MSELNYHPDPTAHPAAVHFDLGVDALATPGEIVEMNDPWIEPPAPADGAAGWRLPWQLPRRDMSPWVAGLQLPGV